MLIHCTVYCTCLASCRRIWLQWIFGTRTHHRPHTQYKANSKRVSEILMRNSFRFYSFPFVSVKPVHHVCKCARVCVVDCTISSSWWHLRNLFDTHHSQSPKLIDFFIGDVMKIQSIPAQPSRAHNENSWSCSVDFALSFAEARTR